MTLCTQATVEPPRPVRRPGRPSCGKKLLTREMPGKLRPAYRRSIDPCDSSNDSGLGFDHHVDPHHPTSSMAERLTWSGERSEPKRLRTNIKVENEEVNDSYCFPNNVLQSKDHLSSIRTAANGTVPSLDVANSPSGRAVPRCTPVLNRQTPSSPMSLTTQLSSSSRFSDVALTIIKQPEQQHRARYQTEGSRGAVKDRDGNGFPIVQLTGYYKPAVLQVYIGTDVGKVTPHMFYQACKVSGKNSTPCVEKKMEGTCVIELGLDPTKDMCATCDCVGILKERNVDVEHRFPDQLGNRSKKKSTRCRMIFRTTITHDNGTTETLQVGSQPIVCTQPPGIPEICKKSLTSCPASGGLELFVLGKNFLKDTKVYFQQFEDGRVCWEQAVAPDKEYLQQTHFVCVVPPYRSPNITEPAHVRLCVVSSGKTSESHQFVYTPVNGTVSDIFRATPSPPAVCGPGANLQRTGYVSAMGLPVNDYSLPVVPKMRRCVRHSGSSFTVHTDVHSHHAQSFKGALWNPSMAFHNKRQQQDLDMMPPPDSNLVPLATRRSSVSLPSTSSHSPPLKQEYMDDSSQDSIEMQPRYRPISESSLDVNHDSNMSMINENSVDLLHQDSMMSHLSENSNLSINDESVEMVSRNSISIRDNVVMNEDSPQPPKVMDLRMKLPINPNVPEYVTTASAMVATLKTIGIDHTSAPLPPQTAQSVESYLTKIESPTLLGGLKADKLPSFFTSQQPFLAETTAKSEAAAVAEQVVTGTTTSSNASTTLTRSLEGSISTPMNAEKLDEILNSTLESHMGSPTKDSVMLTSESALLVPPVITTRMSSPLLTTQEAALTSEGMLDTQLSPSIMCRTSPPGQTESLIGASTLLCQTPTSDDVPTSLLPPVVTAESTALLSADPEKAVIFEAAVDYFKTKEKLCELTTTAQEIMGIAASVDTSPILTMENNLAPSFMPYSTSTAVIQPESLKATENDKKLADRMIPRSFTVLTDNELINLINPTCFDQV